MSTASPATNLAQLHGGEPCRWHPAWLRLSGRQPDNDASAWLGDMTMILDADGILFVRPGATVGRRLPWWRVVTAIIVDGEPGVGPPAVLSHAPGAPTAVPMAADTLQPAGPAPAVQEGGCEPPELRRVAPTAVIFHTENRSYVAVVDDPAGILPGRLADLAPAGVVGTIPTFEPPATSTTASDSFDHHHAAPQFGALPGPMASASGVEAAPHASVAWFNRLRPLLIVVLVLAVAAMVALVLAQSVGALHWSWLGGAGGSTPTAISHRRASRW